AKELQSILDYSRSPGTTSSPAIDPLFSCTEIVDPDGNPGQYGYYWSSSPLQDGPNPYSDAVYFCFGRAQGQMERPPNSGNFQLLDVHGAGAQRNDPKSGNAANYPDYFGPQGDVRYVFNFVRAVRDVSVTTSVEGFDFDFDFEVYPNPANEKIVVEILGNGDAVQQIDIVNLNGVLVKKIISNRDKLLNIDTSDLPAGTYFLSLLTQEHVVTKTIIIH
ncbi:MAG: T9SS type A sorting domain-containing protein, partial [Bacteroidota bacterium]